MRARGLGLICALGQECGYLLAQGKWSRVRRHAGQRAYEREGEGRRVRLVVSGMGAKPAGAGLEVLLEGFEPEAIISFGFGGALDPTSRVGDLIWGKEVLRWEEGRGVCSRLELARPPAALLGQHHSPVPSREGFIVSVEGFVPKARARGALDSHFSPALLEMETYPLAVALKEKRIPLLGLRAVSDEWDFDPAPLVRQWVEADLRVRPWKVIANVARHPTRLTALFGLFQRSRRAAASLAEGIRALLNP